MELPQVSEHYYFVVVCLSSFLLLLSFPFFSFLFLSFPFSMECLLRTYMCTFEECTHSFVKIICENNVIHFCFSFFYILLSSLQHSLLKGMVL